MYVFTFLLHYFLAKTTGNLEILIYYKLVKKLTNQKLHLEIATEDR